VTYTNRATVLVCQWHVESPLLSSRVGGVITVEIPLTETREVSVVLKVKVLRSTHNVTLPNKRQLNLARREVVTSVRPLKVLILLTHSLVLLALSRVNLARRVIATAV
jgi:hypothetical protein